MRDLLWVTKRGKTLWPWQMGDRHLCNSIAKIERSEGRWRGHYLPRLRIEQTARALGLSTRRKSAR